MGIILESEKFQGIEQEKSMSCWNAAARCLYAYQDKKAPDLRFWLRKKYEKNKGISVFSRPTMAKVLDLKTVDYPCEIKAQLIEDWLKNHGPALVCNVEMGE